jgi:hypothetical protein
MGFMTEVCGGTLDYLARELDPKNCGPLVSIVHLPRHLPHGMNVFWTEAVIQGYTASDVLKDFNARGGTVDELQQGLRSMNRNSLADWLEAQVILEPAWLSTARNLLIGFPFPASNVRLKLVEYFDDLDVSSTATVRHCEAFISTRSLLMNLADCDMYVCIFHAAVGIVQKCKTHPRQRSAKRMRVRFQAKSARLQPLRESFVPTESHF